MNPLTKSVRLLITTVCSVLMFGGISACKDLDARLPVGTVDPSFYQTAEAAEQLARGARFEFQVGLRTAMITSGKISDEFFHILGLNSNEGVGVYNTNVVLDQRYLPDETLQKTSIGNFVSDISGYGDLQKARTRSSLARRALAAYAPESPVSLQGEMVAYEAFAEVMLADLYCSGIPLSVLQFEGDYAYRPGSSTTEIYTHAIALFDTAIALAGSDASIEMLARIGKGRALLALGRYDEAASTVSTVPDGYVFELRAAGAATPTPADPHGVTWGSYRGSANIANLKGGNGLNFLNANDPRIRNMSDSIRVQLQSGAFVYTRRPKPQTHIKVATYIEARLIEAEALIQTGNAEFLTILNDLRANVSFPGLTPLTDPALGIIPPGKTTLDVRIDLLMRERAFWLFFRGQRQGDLRRLIRHYNRTVATTYPQGPYPAGLGLYSQYIDIPIPQSELPNKHFTGCLARGA